jgi:methyl-accepting chemotaxis protein
MFKKILHSLTSKINITVLSLIFVTLGLILWKAFTLGEINSVTGNEIEKGKNVIVLSSIFAIVLFILFLALNYFQKIRPLKKIRAAASTIAEKDSLMFSKALTEMARGNLTSSLTLSKTQISSSTNGALGELVNSINVIISNLYDAGKEFNTATDEPCNRLLYIGADSYLEGRTCAETMGKILNGKGKVAIILEKDDIIGQNLRKNGFISLMNEQYPGIKILEFVESEVNETKIFNATLNFVNKYTDLSGIYLTHAGHACAKALKQINKQGKILVVCHDLGNETMKYVAEGAITATISQDEIAQGHDPVIHSYNHIVAGWIPPTPRMLCKMDMITKENYSKFWSPSKGLIENEETKARRPKPLKKSTREIKIAFLGREGNAFWESVQSGVRNATTELQSYNAKVEWIIPKGSHTATGFDVTAKYYGKAIDDLVEQKYDGIIVGVFDKNLVGHINRAVARGVTVCTYNSEPLSFRGLLSVLNQRTKHLITLSQNVTKIVEHSLSSAGTNSESMNQIKDSLNEEATSVNTANGYMAQIEVAIHNIARDSYTQKIAADKVSTSAHHISKVVESVKASSSQVVKSSQEAIEVAKNGTKTVQTNLELMKLIEDAVEMFAQKMQLMADRSERIEEIIKSIEEISSQTNLLALNAAIEAARAGEAGRGFAIVAVEVKHLSEKSATATMQTSDLISGIKKDILEASSSIKEIVTKVKEGALSAEASGVAIDKLLHTSQDMSSQVENVASANNAVADDMDGLISEIDKITEVIEQNMSATEELSTGVKHTVEMINNISGLSDFNASTVTEIAEKISEAKEETAQLDHIAMTLSSMANELQAGIVQFKIEKD